MRVAGEIIVGRRVQIQRVIFSRLIETKRSAIRNGPADFERVALHLRPDVLDELVEIITVNRRPSTIAEILAERLHSPELPPMNVPRRGHEQAPLFEDVHASVKIR